MYMAHTMFRREFSLIPDLVRGAAEGGHFSPCERESGVASGAAVAWFIEHLVSATLGVAPSLPHTRPGR